MNSRRAVLAAPVRPGSAPGPAPDRPRVGWLIGVLAGALAVGLAAGWVLRHRLSPDPAADRARALTLARSQHPQAEPLLRQLLDRHPDDVEAIKAMVGLQMAADRPAEADAYLARWCDQEPDNLHPLRLRFEVASRVFQNDTAIACGRRLLEREADPEPVLRRLMWIEVGSGQVDHAMAHAREGLRRRPGDVDFRQLLAHAHHQKGEPAEAARILDGLLAENGSLLPAALLRGTIHREMNQPDRALLLLRKVLAEEKSPKVRQNARYQLAQALFQLDRADEAAQEMARWQRFEEARRTVVDAYQRPDDRRLRLKAGRLLLETEQDAEGLAVLGEVLAEDPDHPEAHRILAEHFARHGDRDRAEHHRRQIAPGP